MLIFFWRFLVLCSLGSLGIVICYALHFDEGWFLNRRVVLLSVLHEICSSGVELHFLEIPHSVFS